MKKCVAFIVVVLLLFSALYIFKRVEDRKFRALPVRAEIPNLGVWERHDDKSAPQEVVFQLVAPARISEDGRTLEGFDAVNEVLAKHHVESIRELHGAPGQYMAVFKNADIKAIADELAKAQGVEYAEPNYTFSSLESVTPRLKPGACRW